MKLLKWGHTLIGMVAIAYGLLSLNWLILDGGRQPLPDLSNTDGIVISLHIGLSLLLLLFGASQALRAFRLGGSI